MAEDLFGNYMATNEEIAALEKKEAANQKKRNAVDMVALYVVLCFGFVISRLEQPDLQTWGLAVGTIAVFSFLAARTLKTAFLPPLIPKSYTILELWALVLADKQK